MLGVVVVIAGCAGAASPAGENPPSSTGDGGGASDGGSAASDSSGITAGAGGSAGVAGDSGSGAGGATGGSGSPDAAVGGAGWSAGNRNGACRSGVPADGQPADTSHPATVVGTGTPASCTTAALAAAVAKGGVIIFDCGREAATIAVTATLHVPTDRNTVIDGGRLITLDGQNAVRVLSFDSPGWQTNEYRLTLQHLAIVGAKATPTQAIPPAPAPCSQGWNDGQGGGVYMRDGNLTVIDCVFTGNHAAPLGPDTGGGAIYVQGSKHGLLIVGSAFTRNAAANAGAVGGLFCQHRIYDSVFSQNTATGNGANNDDAQQCQAMNNGQHEIGSGGNGGAIYSDGNSVSVTLCGDQITDNAAGSGGFGGGLFFTSNNLQGDLSIADTTMSGNTGGHWTKVATGTITNAGSAVGTNCHSITLQGSTLQGLP